MFNQQNTYRMYKLICQLFLAVIGHNLPEEVFEGTLYWLLQGGRKNRQIIDRNVKQISLMTPYQLQVVGWPGEYIEGQTKKGRIKIHSVLICEKFRQMFHTHNGETFIPCHRYIKIWEEGGEVGYKKTKVRVILYFNSLEEKEKTKNLINTHSGFKNIYEDKILKYNLIANDYSHLCMCSICSKFMPSRAERMQINKRDPGVFEVYCHENRSTISSKNDWNHVLCQVPICEECFNSKERQGKYRLNMYDRDYFKTGYGVVNSPEERKRFNISNSLEVEKPDMTNIPHRDKFMWKTPLDYSGSLKCMLDKYSTYYWHPDLTADEYMRYQEYVLLNYVENADPLDDDGYPSDDFDDYGEYPEDY